MVTPVEAAFQGEGRLLDPRSGSEAGEVLGIYWLQT